VAELLVAEYYLIILGYYYPFITGPKNLLKDFDNEFLLVSLDKNGPRILVVNAE
jgi:hypothetical protein